MNTMRKNNSWRSCTKPEILCDCTKKHFKTFKGVVQRERKERKILWKNKHDWKLQQ